MKSPIQSAPVCRGIARHQGFGAVAQSGCNPFTCLALIPACAAACGSGIGTVACISCLGGAYESCKDCF